MGVKTGKKKTKYSDFCDNYHKYSNFYDNYRKCKCFYAILFIITTIKLYKLSTGTTIDIYFSTYPILMGTWGCVMIKSNCIN